MRNKILYYALKYNGNYDKIFKALKTNEKYSIIKTDLSYITIIDKEYPKKLLYLKKPPLILFYKGNIKLLEKEAVSIVGSRNAKSYGIKYTKILSKQLAKDYVVVSGMAKGIDTYAHYSAIEDGSSIAVLGSGINYIYPKVNKELYNILSNDHLIISEYPNDISPKRYYFPFRNRIIAALSNSVYITQASMRSGTMLTVNEALELNKPVYVLPYNIDDKNGSGCNYLIEQGANMILIDDLLK